MDRDTKKTALMTVQTVNTEKPALMTVQTVNTETPALMTVQTVNTEKSAPVAGVDRHREVLGGFPLMALLVHQPCTKSSCQLPSGNGTGRQGRTRL